MGNEIQARLVDPDTAPVLTDVNVGATKRKREALEALADKDVAEYRCPECGDTYPDERLVRVHATRSQDDAHRNANGFLNVDVEAVDSNGNVMGTIPPAGNLHKDGVMKMTVDDLPEDLSDTEKVILLTACQNAYTEEYSELHNLVTRELRDRGMGDVSYGKVYRFIKDYLDRGTRKKGGEKAVEEKEFEDLTERQQAVVLARARNSDASMSDIAEMVGVDVSYPRQVLDKYDHIAEQFAQMDETDLPDNELLETMSEEANAEWDDLTEVQQEIIDTYAKNPGITNKEVSEEVGCAVSYPSRIKSKYGHLIDARREELGITEEEVSEAGGPRTRPAETWEELTETQQEVAKELLTEDDPTNPDRTHKEIAESADVHSTYVGDVIRKYGDLLEQMGEELGEEETTEDVVQDMPVTGTAAKPMSASPHDLPEEVDAEAEAEQIEEEVEGPVITHGDKAIPVEQLDEYWDEREISYDELQELAIERDIRGDQSSDSLIQAIKEHEGVVEAEEEAIGWVEGEEEAEETAEEAEVTAEAETAEVEAEAAETAEVTAEAEQVEVEAEAEQVTVEAGEAEEVAAAPAFGAAEEEESQMVSIPARELKHLLERAQSVRRTAEREVEFAEGLTSAHGRLAVAEEWENVTETLISEYTGKAPATATGEEVSSADEEVAETTEGEVTSEERAAAQSQSA